MNRTRLGWTFVATVMFMMAVAAVSKASAIGEFRDSLVSSWRLPPRPAMILAVCIPVLEAGISACWFLGTSRRAAIIGAAVLIVIYTSAFGWLWEIRSPPDCACFGKIKMFEDVQRAALWTVLRNVALLGMLPFWTTPYAPMNSTQQASLRKGCFR